MNTYMKNLMLATAIILTLSGCGNMLAADGYSNFNPGYEGMGYGDYGGFGGMDDAGFGGMDDGGFGGMGDGGFGGMDDD